jgi:hypothetical protein
MRAISRELGISHSTVREYLARIAAAGIPWPLPAELTDRELERRLFVNGGVRAGARHYVEPNWAAVARELKRPGSRGKTPGELHFWGSPDAVGYDSLWACPLLPISRALLAPTLKRW